MEKHYFTNSDVEEFKKHEKVMVKLMMKVDSMTEMKKMINKLLGSEYPESNLDNQLMCLAARHILDAFEND